MKKFINGFKEFAKRGNVMDLAVGVIIGAAFKSIVDSLVNDIISPVLGLLTGKNFGEQVIQIGDVTIGYGAFVTAIINFIIIAFVLYLMISAINKADNLLKKNKKQEQEPEPEPPATKVCPYCMSEIPAEATRCGHCTSMLEEKK